MGLQAEGATRADIISLHPHPITYQVHRSTRDGRHETTIARCWRAEDARRCVLCATCTATVGRQGKTALCLKRVPWAVPDAEVELFRDPTLPADVGGADEQSRTVS